MYKTETKKYNAPNGITVMCGNITLPEEFVKGAEDFYKKVSEGFEQGLEKDIYRIALQAYDNCTDRRKRFRYEPKIAEFACRVSDNDTYDLTVSYDGIHFIKETHKWSDGIIVRRRRLKK